MVLIDYDLIDMIFLITVMHVFALDMVNSNLLFGISSVVFFDNRYLSHIQLDFLLLPLLSSKRVGSGVGFHGIFTMYYLFGDRKSVV